MSWPGIDFGAIAAGTFAAAQGFVEQTVKDAQQVDWDEVSKNFGQGAAFAFGATKGATEKAVVDLQHVDWEEVSKHVGEGAGGALEAATQALENAVKDTHHVEWILVAQALQKDGATVLEAAKKGFGNAIEGLKNVKWKDVPEAARRYIEEYPILTAVQVVALLLVVCAARAGVLSSHGVGFREVGPVAGSFAAWHQSVYGVNFVFSGLQSAAMAGYGGAVVNGVIQGSAVAALVAAEVAKQTDGKELIANDDSRSLKRDE